MEENKYTELDKLFKNRLSEAGNEAGQWNTPSDDLFAAAQNEIKKEKDSKRRTFFFWFFGFGIVGLFLLITLFNLNKIEQLENKVYQMSQEVPVSSEDSKELDDGAIVLEDDNLEIAENQTNQEAIDDLAENVDSKRSFNNEKEESNSLNVGKPTITSSLTPNKKNISIVNNAIEVNKKNSNIALESEIQSQTESTSNIEENIISEISRDLIFIDLLDQREMKLLNSDEVLVETMNPFSIPKDFDDRSWQFSTFFGPSATSMEMTNLEPVPYELIDYDKSYLGFRGGINVLQTLGKNWGINYQVSLQKMTNESAFSNKLNYDIQNEFVDFSGKTIYDDIVDIESPTGAFAANFEFNNDIVAMNSDETMDNSTATNQRYWMIGIGLKPNFNMTFFESWEIGLGIGPELHYIIDYSQKMDMELKNSNSHNSILNKSYEETSMQTINRFLLGIASDLNIQYKVNDQLSIGAQLGIMRSVNSLRKQNNSTISKTYLTDFRTGLSLSYRLK